MSRAGDYADPTCPATNRRPATSDGAMERRRDHARELRRDMSLPEVLLWKRLRGRSTGRRWRRQHPIGPYVADFYCHECRFVLEIDGQHHAGRIEEDEAKDAYLAAHGYHVVRRSAKRVLADPDQFVVAMMLWMDAKFGPPES